MTSNPAAVNHQDSVGDLERAAVERSAQLADHRLEPAGGLGARNAV